MQNSVKPNQYWDFYIKELKHKLLCISVYIPEFTIYIHNVLYLVRGDTIKGNLKKKGKEK